MGYVTVAELRGEIQNASFEDSTEDPTYADVIDAASKAIDDYCGRTFVVPTQATARLFRPTRTLTAVDDLDDIASTTDLAVAVDTSASGSFTATTDYAAETNRDGMVVAIRSTVFFPYSSVRPRTIQVTARWGWPATPDPVKRACLIWATRLVNRRNSPTGIVGFGEYGGVRLSTVDPDVRSLLAPYRDLGGLLR